jgi:hypothetical protein
VSGRRTRTWSYAGLLPGGGVSVAATIAHSYVSRAGPPGGPPTGPFDTSQGNPFEAEINDWAAAQDAEQGAEQVAEQEAQL